MGRIFIHTPILRVLPGTHRPEIAIYSLGGITLTVSVNLNKLFVALHKGS